MSNIEDLKKEETVQIVMTVLFCLALIGVMIYTMIEGGLNRFTDYLLLGAVVAASVGTIIYMVRNRIK